MPADTAVGDVLQLLLLFFFFFYKYKYILCCNSTREPIKRTIPIVICLVAYWAAIWFARQHLSQLSWAKAKSQTRLRLSIKPNAIQQIKLRKTKQKLSRQNLRMYKMRYDQHAHATFNNLLTEPNNCNKSGRNLLYCWFCGRYSDDVALNCCSFSSSRWPAWAEDSRLKFNRNET